MMKSSKLKLWIIAILASTIFVSCSDDETVVQPKVIDFGVAPSSSMITTGSVNVITENTVRYHTIDFAAAPYTVTIIETEDKVILVDL
ncbi:MAG: hypothetical protein RIF34_06725, partial [Candidatus Kapaibacterium sp.]